MITDLVTGGLSGAFVAWLIQLWLGTRLRRSIEHEYQKRIEEIRTKSAKELSRLNSALQETRDFKALRLRVVYERKIAALCEGLKGLRNLNNGLANMLANGGTFEDQGARVRGKILPVRFMTSSASSCRIEFSFLAPWPKR